MIFKLRNLILYHVAWSNIDKVLKIVEAVWWVWRFTTLLSNLDMFEILHTNKIILKGKKDIGPFIVLV